MNTKDGWLRTAVLFAFILLSPLAYATTTVNHQFTPATIDQGGASTYRVTFANDDTGAGLTDMLFTILLQPQITIATPLNFTDTCGFTINQPLTPGGSTIELADGALAAAAPGVASICYFEIDITSIVPGNWVNTIPANPINGGVPTITPDATTTGYLATSGGVFIANTTLANATLAVNTLSPPTGGKGFIPSPAVVGDPVTLTITLFNPNAAATMPLTTFTDVLPDDGSGNEMLVDGTPAVSCTGAGSVDGSVAAAGNLKSITLTGGTIGEGGSCTITVPVSVDSIEGESQIFTNALAAGAIGNTRGLTSPAFSEQLEVITPILISKSFGTSPVPAGQPSLMTLTVTNRSTGNALDITAFSDDLTGTTLKVLTTASAPVAAPADPAVSCTGAGANNGTLDFVADAEDTTISLTNATAGTSGECTITAWVTSDANGSHPNTTSTVTNPDNFASTPASDTLTTLAGLTVEKSVTVGSVAPGQWTEFAVTIKNYAGGPVTDVFFQDLLPAAGGFQMVVFNPGAGIYDTSPGCIGGTFTGLTAGGADTGLSPVSGVDAGLQWTGGTIEAGSGATPGECTITLRALVPAGAPTGLQFTNSIPENSITGQGPSEPVSNEGSSASAEVGTVSLVAVAKDFDPAMVAQGQVATLTLTVFNRVLNPLTGINLTDSLPAGLELAANPASTNSCGGSLQAFPGDTQVILTGGTAAARPDDQAASTCTITVRVVGNTVGTFTNTIDPADFTSSEGTIPDPVSDDLTVTTGLTGSKGFTPVAVTSGGIARLSITITNESNTELTNVSIDDAQFGAGLTVANPANASTNCAGPPTLVINPGANFAELLGTTLTAGASCTVSFDVATSGAGPWSNTIAVGGVTSAEGPVNTQAIAANLGSVSAIDGDIGINKAFQTPIVTGGVPSVLQIDVINNASFEITGAKFTDTFPDGIEIYSVPDASTTCAGGTVTAIPGDGNVVLSGATLAPTSTCSVFVTTTSVKFLNLTNTIPAGAIDSNEGYTNSLGTTATLSTLAGLGVMKGFAPPFIGVGATTRLKVMLVNSFDPNAFSAITLNDVSFTDTLPAGLTVANPLSTSTTCSDGGGGFATVTAVAGGDSVSLTGASITAGSTCVVEVDVTASALGAYDNTILKDGVTSAEGINNQDSASAPLDVVTQPTLAKAFSPSPVLIGQVSRLTLTINNGSGVALSGVALADSLPDGVALVAAPNATTTCNNGVVTANPGGGVLSIAGAVLANGASCTFSADVLANTTGSFANAIPAGALVTDQGLTNPAQVDAILDVLPPASVAKNFNPVQIAAGGVSTLTITLNNSSSDPITLTAPLVDALPGNVLVANPPNLGGSCPGAKTAVAGGTSVTLAGGSSIPAGSCTVTVDVTSSVGGGYVNVIAAGQLQTSAGNNQDPAIATLGVDQPAAPTMQKAFAPTTIFAGDTASLTITLGNANASALTLTAPFTDTLPADLTIQGTPATDCGGVLTSDPGSVTLSSGATIPAGGCTITATVTSGVAGAYTNTIATMQLFTDAGSPPLPAEAGLVVKTLTPPSVQKSFSPSSINPGGISTLTIVLSNDNASDITLQSMLTDTLPADVQVAAAPAIGGSCPGSIGAAAGGSVITYASGAIIPPGVCTITVDVTSSEPGGPYVNTIPAGALDTDAGGNGAAAFDNLFVNPLQPPSVSKSFMPTPLPKNGTSMLAISLANGNSVPITLTADFIDALPAGLVIATPNGLQTGPGCDAPKVLAPAGGTEVTYQSGAVIAADSGCSIQVNVTSATAGTYTNNIGAGDLETDAGSNTVGAVADVRFVEWPTDGDIFLGKSIDPGSGVAGSSQEVTLTWRNQNPESPVRNLYQCVVSDPLPAAAFDLTSVAEDATPAGYTFSYDGSTVTYTRNDTTAPCETALQTATFTVNLKANVVTGSTYTNTATAIGQTLPSDDPNAGLAETRSKNASADVVVTPPTASAKTVVSTSQDFTDPGDVNKNADPPVAIGETVTYSVPFALPPGVTNAVVLADEVTTGIGDVALLSATLARSSIDLTAAGNPAGINAEPSGSPVDVTGLITTVGDELRLALGNVTNADSANQNYTLEVTVRIANVPENTLGHLITDRGRLHFQNSGGTNLSVTSEPRTVHIGLPGIAVSKSVDPAAPSAGDTVTYMLTISNPAGANAVAGFEIEFTDTLPADLVSPTAPTFDVGATGATASGSFTGNVLTGAIDQLDPGESVVVTYTAQVPVSTPFGKTIVNAASAQITTLPPGPSDDERTISSTAATAPLITTTPSINKEVVNPQARYAIGDLVDYRITVSLPVGTTTNFTVNDTLPAGLAYVDGSAQLTVSAGVSGPTVGTGPTGPNPIVPGAPLLTFPLDSITVTAAGTITIDFQAQVLNVSGNQNNTPLANQAQATYDNPQGGTATITVPTPPEIVVGEPNFTMTKTIVSGATGAQAGSVVRWQFTVQNSGTTIAYQAAVGDTLPPGLSGISNIAVTPSGGNIQQNNAGCASGAAVSATDAVVTTTNNADDSITLAGLCFAPGTTLTVAFDSTVLNSVTPGEMLNNIVSGTYASQPADSSATDVVRDGADAGSDDDTDPGNNYNESASNTLTIDAPIAIDKQASTETATIGETLTYTLKVSLIQGNTPSVVVTDILPTGLSYVSHTISMGNMGITPVNSDYADRLGSGQTVQFDFGNIQNNPNGNATDDFVEIDITVRVDNIEDNQNGDVLSNGESGTVTVEYGAIPTSVPYDFDGNLPGIQGRPLTITEPVLESSKSVMPASQSLGDIVTFTIMIEHTAASTADAFDVELTDTLPTGLEFIAGSVMPANAFVGIAGQVLSLRVDPSDPLTLLKHHTTITYQARILTSAAVGSPLNNLVAGNYASILGGTGAEDSGRNGTTAPPSLNDYTFSASAAVTPNQSALIYPTKTVTQVTDGNSDGILDPGEQIEYTIVLNNTSMTDTLTNLSFTDLVPPQTTYVTGSLSSTLGTVDETGAPILEVSIPSLGPGSAVTVTFRAEVNAGVPVGTTISNQGSVDSDQTVPTPTDADGVPGNGAQPTPITVGGTPTPATALYADKLVSLLTDDDASGSVTPGDTMRYTIVLNNVGGSPLSAITFSDTIPAGLTYVAASAAASSGTVSVIGQDVSWTGLVSLAPGAFFTATFDVTITSVTPPSQTFVNQGTATSAETDAVSTDSNGNPSDGSQPTQFTAVNGGTASPALDVQKSSAVIVDTAPVGVASPQDTLLYTITIANNGSAPATDVRLTDPDPVCTGALDPCTAYVPGSLTTSLGAIVSETPIEVNLGTVPVGALATVTFRVQVDAATADGVIVANQALVTRAGGGSPVPSDDNGNPADGLNPTLTPISVSTAGGVPGSLTKTLMGTSEPDAFSTGSTALIGEVARFQVAVGMPKGTLEQVTLHDTLPAGASYLPGSATLTRVFDTGLAASADPGGVNGAPSGTAVALIDGADIVIAAGAGSTTTLAVFLGDVIDSDNDMNVEQYLLEYRVVVQNVSGNQAGTTLSNAATVSFWNTLSQIQTLTPVNSTLTVAEPVITVDKSVSPAALLSTGGTTTYTFTIANAPGAAPAFDIDVIDPLPAVFTSMGTPSIVSSGATGVVDTSSGTTVSATIDRLDAGGSVTITVTATAPGPLADGPIPNSVNTTWTTLPGSNGSAADGGVATPGAPGSVNGERTGSGSPNVNDNAGSAPATIQVGSSNVTKSLVNPQTRYAIGDPVSYRVEVTIPGSAFGTLGNVEVSDVLDEGLTYVPGSLAIAYNTASSSLDPSNFTRADDTPASGQETLTLALGTVSNSDAAATTIVLTYEALVDNILGNQANSSLSNAVSLSFSDPGAGGATVTRGPETTTVEVGEPFLTLTKTLTSPAAGLQAGSTASFSVVAGNTGTTTAFETVVSDVLPVGLFFPGGSVVTVVANNVSGQLETPTVTVTAADWQTSEFDLPVGDTVTFTFTVTLANSVNPGDTLQNEVTVGYTSRDGDDVNERSDATPDSEQSDDTDLDNYNTSALSGTITVDDPIAIDKTFWPDPAQNSYQIGDLVTYRLNVSLLVGTTAQVAVMDLLPDGLTYESSNVGTPAGAPITYTYSGTPTQLGQQLTFDLGDVVNAAETPVNSNNDFITIDVMARVADVPGNVDGTVLGNNASVGFDDPNGVRIVRDFDADAGTPGVQPLDLIVLVPDLQISKDDGGVTVTPGDTVSYTLRYQNVGGGEATGVVITETVPDNTVFDAPASTPGWSCVPDGSAGSSCTLNVGGVAAGAPEATASFAVTVLVLPAGVTQVTNNASINDDATHGADPTPDNNGASDNTPVDAAPDLVITKNDGGLTALPGDTVSYILTFQNVGDQDATGVVLTETVPTDTTFNAGASTAGWTCVPDGAAGSSCTLAIGDVAAGAAAATATFAVDVDNPVPAGVTQVANSISIADDGSNGADPTPVNNGDDDTTPVDAAPDLVISKDDGGITALPGDTVSYILTFQNVGNQDATGVVLTETVPADTMFNAGASTAGWTCVPDGAAGSSCTLAIGDVAAGAEEATATFAVDVHNPVPAGVTQVANSVSIADDGSNGADPTPDNNTDPDTTQVNAEPDLVISKDDGGITAMPGDTVSYTLTYQNVGNQDATGVVLTETVPAHTVFDAGTSTAGWSCVPDALAGSGCTLAIGGVAAGAEAANATFSVQVFNPLPAGITQVANIASIADDGSNGTDPTPDNNTDPDTTPVIAMPDLVIDKDDGGITALPGDTVSYILTYQNVGNQDATGGVLTETVPADTTFNAGASTAGWTCVPDGMAGSDCTLVIGDVAAGAAAAMATFAVDVVNPMLAGVSQISNTASVADDGGNGADPTPENNTDPDSTPVDAAPDLVVSKDDGGVTALPGDTVSYTITYQNVGNQDSTGIVLNETVPVHTTFNAGASTAGWSCVPDALAGSSCTLAVGSLAAGAPSVTAIFAVDVDDPVAAGVTGLDNSVSIADDGTNGDDLTPENDSYTVTTPVGGPASFRVTKHFTDGNPMDVEVTISCNTGLPLTQSQEINEDEPVTFVVTSFTPGQMDCDIAEVVPEGYSPSFEASATETGNALSIGSDSEGCHFEGIGFGGFVCDIVNTPDPVEIEIEKDWVFATLVDSHIETYYELTLYCDGEIVDHDDQCESPADGLSRLNDNGNGTWCKRFSGYSSAIYTAQVIPDYPSTHCHVVEEEFDSAVEIENGCQDLTVSAGARASCLITNTVFFEGIPTLNQFGMAILALLMLGIGFVSFRRMV